MFRLKDAVERYRAAELFGLPFKICIKVFLFGKGRPIENFEKMINDKKGKQ